MVQEGFYFCSFGPERQLVTDSRDISSNFNSTIILRPEDSHVIFQSFHALIVSRVNNYSLKCSCDIEIMWNSPSFYRALKSVFIGFETRCSDFHLEVVFLGTFSVWCLYCDPLSALSLVHNIPVLFGLKLQSSPNSSFEPGQLGSVESS